MTRPVHALSALLGFDPRPLVEAALREDLGASGDVTTAALIPPDQHGEGTIVTREELVLAGGPLAEAVFGAVDPALAVEWQAGEGERCAAGRCVARLTGNLGSILIAERTALNALQRLSGIATHAARYAAAVAGTGVAVCDTRKTTPGLRGAEKYAVRTGGCVNHRAGLYDGVLIKDNHVAVAGSVAGAVARARRAHHLLKIEVEVETEAQALEAVAAGADVLLLDNFAPVELAAAVRAVRAVAPGVTLEASGGITLDELRAYAAAGVDLISTGAVIHAARWVDLSLELSPP